MEIVEYKIVTIRKVKKKIPKIDQALLSTTPVALILALISSKAAASYLIETITTRITKIRIPDNIPLIKKATSLSPKPP